MDTRMQTIRERLYGQYQQMVEEERQKGRSKAFYMRAKPYHSTQILTGQIIAVNEANEANVAFVKFPKGQSLLFFDYGIGANVYLGGPANTSRKATESDTNLVKAKSTNGASDYAIEGISFGFRDTRILYPDAQIALITASTDQDLLASLRGLAPLVDPASIVTPPQQGSPFNAEFPFWHGLADLCSVEAQWDGGTPTFKLGTCGMFPDASGKSQIRASGMPQSDNAYRIPEGYLWARDGVAESELIIDVTLEETVIVPINLPVRAQDSTAPVVPTEVYVSVQCRLFGTEFQMTNVNG